jgi:outer membrane protein TolC
MKRLLSLITVSIVFTASGCTVGPDYVQPEVETVPDAWNTAATKGLAEGEASIQTWWTVFDDPTLTSLIERSRTSNLTLREAMWRVEEARSLRGIVAGERAPQVGLDGAAGRSEPSANGPLGGVVPADQFEAQNLFDLGVAASWELDLWGRIRRQVEAADAEVAASVEDYRDVLVTLFAEQLTKDRFDSGLVSALDVAQAESNLGSTRALIPSLEQDLELDLNLLAFLMAMSPGSLDEELGGENPIPTEPQGVTTGLPADLLRQRPDIRSAERRLAAQTARIGVATAELYPQFSLTGFLGLQSTSGGDLFSSESVTWSVGLPIRWRLFAGGSIRSQIDAEKARTAQLIANYERAVLLALEEVEGAMVSYEKEVSRRGRLAESVDATQRSLELVLTQYTAGLTDFQNVLDTQRSLLLREDDLASSEGIVIRNLVDLYRALGGGWDPDSAEPPLPEETLKEAIAPATEDGQEGR